MEREVYRRRRWKSEEPFAWPRKLPDNFQATQRLRFFGFRDLSALFLSLSFSLSPARSLSLCLSGRGIAVPGAIFSGFEGISRRSSAWLGSADECGNNPRDEFYKRFRFLLTGLKGSTHTSKHQHTYTPTHIHTNTHTLREAIERELALTSGSSFPAASVIARSNSNIEQQQQQQHGAAAATVAVSRS